MWLRSETNKCVTPLMNLKSGSAPPEKKKKKESWPRVKNVLFFCRNAKEKNTHCVAFLRGEANGVLCWRPTLTLFLIRCVFPLLSYWAWQHETRTIVLRENVGFPVVYLLLCHLCTQTHAAAPHKTAVFFFLTSFFYLNWNDAVKCHIIEEKVVSNSHWDIQEESRQRQNGKKTEHNWSKYRTQGLMLCWVSSGLWQVESTDVMWTRQPREVELSAWLIQDLSV